MLTSFAATYSGEGVNHDIYEGVVNVQPKRLFLTVIYILFRSNGTFIAPTLANTKPYVPQRRLRVTRLLPGHIFQHYRVPSGIPLYRFFNAAINSHLWTVDSNEFYVLFVNGWTPAGHFGNALGVDGYVLP